MVDNLQAAFSAVPEILAPLKRCLRKIDRTGKIPVLVNLDMNRISPDGAYCWQTIKDLLEAELGWQCAEKDKGLHTSCLVEDCKDHSQFVRSIRHTPVGTKLTISGAVVGGACQLRLADTGPGIRRKKFPTFLSPSIMGGKGEPGWVCQLPVRWWKHKMGASRFATEVEQNLLSGYLS